MATWPGVVQRGQDSPESNSQPPGRARLSLGGELPVLEACKLRAGLLLEG